MKKYLKIIFVAVGLLIIILPSLYIRANWLEISPHTIGFDEAALGYNAFSLLKTGKDEHGRGYSISLASFNDYKPALYAYLSMPFIYFKGLTQTSTRLVSAFAGAMALLFIFWIGYFFFGKDLAKAFFFLLLAAVQPWLFHYSRTAFESNLSAVLFLGGVLFILVNRGRRSELTAVFFLALSMYAYHSARVAAPAFLFFYGLIKIRKKRKIRVTPQFLLETFLPLFLLILITLPVWLNLSDGLILTRLRQESALKRLYPYAPPELVDLDNLWTSFPAHPLYYLSAQFMGHAFAYFSPINLGVRVYHWVRNSPMNIASFSLIGWGETLFFLFGLFYLLKHWQKRNSQVVFAWVIAGILPAIVTWNWLHPLRSLAIYPAVLLVCVSGIIFIFKALPRPLKAFAVLAFIPLFLMQTAYLINNEIIYNVYESHGEYQPGGFKEGVPELAALQDDYDKIVVETPHAQGYIFFLFYQSFPPEILQQYTKNRKLPGTEGDLSFNFDKYEFRKINWLEDKELERTLFWGSIQSLPPKEISQDINVKIIKEYVNVAGNPTAVIMALE